jgi:hypothetical protein
VSAGLIALSERDMDMLGRGASISRTTTDGGTTVDIRIVKYKGLSRSEVVSVAKRLGYKDSSRAKDTMVEPDSEPSPAPEPTIPVSQPGLAAVVSEDSRQRIELEVVRPPSPPPTAERDELPETKPW